MILTVVPGFCAIKTPLRSSQSRVGSLWRASAVTHRVVSTISQCTQYNIQTYVGIIAQTSAARSAEKSDPMFKLEAYQCLWKTDISGTVELTIF